MNDANGFERLKTRRKRLLAAYDALLAMFAPSVAMAASGAPHAPVLVGAGLCALLALPLFVFTVAVHRAVQAVRPGAGSVRIKQLVFSVVVFTPIEAALVLPAINLVVSRRLLRARAPSAHGSANPPPAGRRGSRATRRFRRRR